MIRQLIDRVRKGPMYKYRSSVTGRYVSWFYAKLNPATTMRERVR